MTNAEIYTQLYNIGGIYGYRYGRREKTHSIEEDIIWIPQKTLSIGIHADCFIYVWGWPGPDVNLYNFKDYGKTWSFNKQDLLDNENS